MKNIISVVILIFLAWGVMSLFKQDAYIGFYYPDINDLTNDIQSTVSFSSLEACRDWVDEQASFYNQNDSNYDYECGKNCDISGGKPYICEETLQ